MTIERPRPTAILGTILVLLAVAPAAPAVAAGFSELVGSCAATTLVTVAPAPPIAPGQGPSCFVTDFRYGVCDPIFPEPTCTYRLVMFTFATTLPTGRVGASAAFWDDWDFDTRFLSCTGSGSCSDIETHVITSGAAPRASCGVDGSHLAVRQTVTCDLWRDY